MTNEKEMNALADRMTRLDEYLDSAHLKPLQT
jgi:hypothetical protein